MINLLTRVASRLWPQRRTAFDTLRVTTTLNQFRIIAYLPVMNCVKNQVLGQIFFGYTVPVDEGNALFDDPKHLL